MKDKKESYYRIPSELQKTIDIAQTYASQPAVLAQQEYLSSLEGSIGHQQSIIEQVMEASKAYDSIMESIINGPAYLVASDVIPSVAHSLGISSAIDVFGDICSKACNSSIQSILANKDYFDFLEQLSKITNNFINPVSIVENSFLKSIDYDNEAFEKILQVDELSIEDVDYAIENNQITDEDLKNEVKEIIKGDSKKRSTIRKKILFAIASFIITSIMSFILFDVLLGPVKDAARNRLIDELKINEFWQDTGIIDLIENTEFNVDNSNDEQYDEDVHNNRSKTADL